MQLGKDITSNKRMTIWQSLYPYYILSSPSDTGIFPLFFQSPQSLQVFLRIFGSTFKHFLHLGEDVRQNFYPQQMNSKRIYSEEIVISQDPSSVPPTCLALGIAGLYCHMSLCKKGTKPDVLKNPGIQVKIFDLHGTFC